MQEQIGELLKNETNIALAAIGSKERSRPGCSICSPSLTKKRKKSLGSKTIARPSNQRRKIRVYFPWSSLKLIERGNDTKNNQIQQWSSDQSGLFWERDVYSVAIQIVRSVERCHLLSWRVVNVESEPLSAYRLSGNVKSKTAAQIAELQSLIIMHWYLQ